MNTTDKDSIYVTHSSIFLPVNHPDFLSTQLIYHEVPVGPLN